MISRVSVFIGLVLGVVFIAGCEKREMHVKTVNVSASTIYCRFDPSCAVNSNDSTTTPIPMQAGGTALLHSRTFAGKPGTPASGLYGYEYRLDLEKASETMVEVEGVATKRVPCLLTMSLEFGPIVDTLDYDGDGKAGDLIYIVTSGGPGTIRPGAVHRWRNKLIVNFDTPVCVGPSGDQGHSSYLFGLASTQPPTSVEATVKETAGLAAAPVKYEQLPRAAKLEHLPSYNVPVRGPQISPTQESERSGS
ncbi:protein of unknown function [Candidatus Methylomirabilis oxygeniifera]|uniref:Lipoprotein n=1 Tax=Methylomirabilis oxygeniifera TaxID=671143 RepID=D5MLJ2_METO1|nr:protein of unknown function [Candidatus Methylomirabilis oxyfera]